MGGYVYTVVALVFLVPALGVACWWDSRHPDPGGDWDGWAGVHGRVAKSETTGSRIGGAVGGVVALVALVVAARNWQEHRGAETALLVAGSALLLGGRWALMPFEERMHQRRDLRRAARVRELAARDPEYARRAAAPAAPPATDETVEPVEAESPTSAEIEMTATEVESRLGIHFDEQWDGAEFVGSASFSLDGIGRVVLVHRGGADAEGVEVHLEDGSTGSTEKLAAALGLPPEKLRMV